MLISRDPFHGQFIIRGYQPGELCINDKILTTSVIITPTELIPTWHPLHFSDFTINDLHPLLMNKPDLIIIGTGAHLQLIDTAAVQRVQAQGVGIEVMSTAAACRTFNVLMAEGRNATAGLIIA